MRDRDKLHVLSELWKQRDARKFNQINHFPSFAGENEKNMGRPKIDYWSFTRFLMRLEKNCGQVFRGVFLILLNSDS